MTILGINFYYHDSTACVVRDGRLIVAIEEERLTREKHTGAFPHLAIARCLRDAGLEARDIEHVAVSIQPRLHATKKILHLLKNVHGSKTFLAHEFRWARQKIRTLYRWFHATFPGEKPPQLHLVPHHLAHVVGSFQVSPYENAALLGIDGCGEWATTFMGVGRGTAFEQFREDYFPVSLGLVYSAVTEYCGFIPDYDEGKTMGLAPLGNPDGVIAQVERMFWVNDDMSLGVDQSFFNFQCWGEPRCSAKFHATFGPPRLRHKTAPFEPRHLNLAAAFQLQLEDCMLKLARQLRQKTGMEHLVLSGGVSLNSVANGRIVRESGFKDVYVMPAAGDNGTAIGAAFYVHHSILGHPRGYVHDDPFIGTGYSEEQIVAIMDECKLRRVRHDDIEAATAALLSEGRILGWFQGRMEIGPRSLGNRSILANPLLAGMKDKVNAEVKHREAFRPFAPSCPIEDAPRFFEQQVADPFMLKVCDVREEYRTVIPATTHVDGTARLQTIHAATNPRFHRLLKELEKRTGIPVVLNTSFNIMGEPIVESPYDAIRCFFSTGLDCLVLGNYIINK